MGRVSYENILGAGIILRVSYLTKGREVLSYSLVLMLEVEGAMTTVRVYDAAHHFNEMHRYSRNGGKQRGVRFHRGTLGEGMRAAIKDIERSFEEIIEGWRDQ